MLMLSWIFKLNNHIFQFYKFFYRPPPRIVSVFYLAFHSILLWRFHYGRLFKTIPGDDLPPWAY